MKKFETLIILAMVCGGAFLLYQKLDSMGPEFEPQSLPVRTETAVTETKPAAPETPAQPAPATPAPAPAETPATTTAATPATPATPSPSAAPAAQPAAQPAAPATPMAEQPTTPAAAPAQPATPVAAQPSPAAPAQPAPTTPAQPTPTAVPPAPPTATPAPATPVAAQPVPAAPAPAAAMPTPPPAAQPPAQVATATPPPAPAAQPAPPPQKKLAEMTQDDLMARLPVNARTAYRMARSTAESKGEMIGLRSWFGQWRRYLVDPPRAVLELDMASLLIQNKGSYANESAAKAARRGNANEAKMLISGIVSRRINNTELSDMVEKVRLEVDRELDQTK